MTNSTFMKQVRSDIKTMSPKKFNRAYPTAPKVRAAKLLRGANFTKHAKVINTSVSRLGGVIGAAAYGASKIWKASKAANKEIESQHSPASMKQHDFAIKKMHANSLKKQAAKKLRKSAKPKDPIIPKRTWVAGGQGNKGFNQSMWD